MATLDSLMLTMTLPPALMDRYECRKAMIKDLEDEGLLVKVEDHSHNVGQ